MVRIPFPEDVEADLIESQRPDSLPEEYSHLKSKAARDVYRSVAHEPEVVRTLRAYIGATWEHSGLSDRVRELLLLSLAREIDSEYEWHQHVRITILEGLTPEEILAVSAGDFAEFTEEEQAVMEFTQVAANMQSTDEDVERLRRAQEELHEEPVMAEFTEAKERLELDKRPGESYEDVIIRLTSRDKWAGFGALADADGDLQEGMQRVREEMRRGMEEDVEEIASSLRDSDEEPTADRDGGGSNDQR